MQPALSVAVRRSLWAPQTRFRLWILFGVLLLLVISVLLFRLQQQISAQRHFAATDTAFAALSEIAELEREHLRLTAQIRSGGSLSASVTTLDAQRQAVEERLKVLEARRFEGGVHRQISAGIADYRQRWDAIQPAITIFGGASLSINEQTLLLTELEEMDSTLADLFALCQQASAAGNAANVDRIQSALNGLIAVSVLFSVLLVLAFASIRHFFFQQRRTQRALRNSEMRHRAIVDALPYAVYRIKADGTLRDIRSARDDDASSAHDRSTPLQLTDQFAPDVSARLLQAVTAALASGEEQLVEYSVAGSAANAMQLYEARIVASGWNEVQAIVREITSERQRQETIRQAQKLESLGVLAGGIAHEFNNLLTGMLGQTSLAQTKLPVDSPAMRHVDRAAHAARRAADLTRQLVAYAGKGSFEIAYIDLNELIIENTGLLETAVSNRADLVLELEGELPSIHADRGQIQQVILNLVINAAEALPDDGGLVNIQTSIVQIDERSALDNFIHEELWSGHYVSLRVTDNGCGMDKETQARIFDPFFSTKPSGHGLGLSATLGIIRTHDGAVRVESTPGAGTQFELLLPAHPRKLETTTENAVVPVCDSIQETRL